MNFLVLLTAVVIEFTLAWVVHLRAPHWSTRWAAWLATACAGLGLYRGAVGAALLLGLPLAGAALLFDWLWDHASLFYHLASLALLVWLLGPTDLKREIEEYRRSLGAGRDEYTPAFAVTTAGLDLGPASGDPEFDACRGEFAAIALSAERAWFAPLFWFFVAGPVGVLAYRLAANLEHAAEVEDSIARVVGQVHEALACVPARITALSLGVAGTLVPVLEGLVAGGLFRWGASAQLVARAALAATDHGRVHDDASDAPRRYRAAQMDALVRRALNVWMVLFAVAAVA